MVLRLTFCGLLLMQINCASADVRVDLNKEVVLVGRQIRLSDIGVVTELGKPTGIGASVIGPGPRTGQVASLTRRDIEMALRLRAGNNEKIVWSGASTVAVRPAVQSITGKALGDVAIAYVRSQLEARYPKLTVRLDGEMADLDIRPGTFSIAARPLRSVEPRSRESIWIDIVDETGVERSVVVPVVLSIPGQAAFAIRNLAPGHPIAPDDVELREVDLAAAGRGASDSSVVARARVRTAIKSGELIMTRAIVAHGGIMRGDVVKVSMHAGAVRIASTGVAQADARREEKVRIRMTSGTMLDGRVIADDMVVIE
jgi:flagella basal body P-ring formation protein FlgA